MSDTGANGSRGPALHNTADRIRRAFISSLNLNLNSADLGNEQRLDDLVGLDSLAVIEFVTAIEKEFGITFEPELLRLDFVRSLPQLSAYVEDRVAQAGRLTT